VLYKNNPNSFLKLTIHTQHRLQGRSEQQTALRISAFCDLALSFCEQFLTFQSITVPSSSVSDHLHLNVRVPQSFQTSGATHKTTKSQKVSIFSKTAVRTSNFTINLTLLLLWSYSKTAIHLNYIQAVCRRDRKPLLLFKTPNLVTISHLR